MEKRRKDCQKLGCVGYPYQVQMARRMLFIARLGMHFCSRSVYRDMIFLIQRHEVEVFSLLSGEGYSEFYICVVFRWLSTRFVLCYV